MNLNDEEIKVLMVASQKGDQAAYEDLLVVLVECLEKFLSRKIFRADCREDVLQSILMAFHEARHSYRPSQAFLSWFYAIAHYKVVDFIKLTEKEKHVFDLSAFEDLLSSNDKYELIFELESLLKDLSVQEKDLLRWLKLDGYSVKELSQFLNKSESSIKVMTHRLLKKLKALNLNVYLVSLFCGFVTNFIFERIFK